MIFTAHQPNLLPWLPFWVKADTADVFGLMPSVQYSKGAYHNRVRIGRDDSSLLFSVPVSVSLGQRIDEARIAETTRTRKLSEMLYLTYKKFPMWPKYGAELVELVNLLQPGALLASTNRVMLDWLAGQLAVKCRFTVITPMAPDASENLAAWSAIHGCDTYLSGAGAVGYLQGAPFAERNCTIKYSRPVIRQGYKTVTALTALLDYGSDWRNCVEANNE